MNTEIAKQQQNKIKEDYIGLSDFYQPLMGNFSFTKIEVYENITDIVSWLEEFDDFILMFEEGMFYLTDTK